MNILGKFLCKCGFHKWMDKDAVDLINFLSNRDIEIRQCNRCNRQEQKMESILHDEHYWCPIENGLEKYDGPGVLRGIFIMVVLSLYIIAVFRNYIFT